MLNARLAGGKPPANVAAYAVYYLVRVPAFTRKANTFVASRWNCDRANPRLLTWLKALGLPTP
jgi:hypothetical protein